MPEVTGLLYSQIGYGVGEPKRVIVRGGAGLLSDAAAVRLTRHDGSVAAETALTRWGELWGSTWWVAAFADVRECGEFGVAVVDRQKTVLEGDGLRIGRDVLWESTWRHCSYEMFERRAIFAKAGSGWFDAGMLWQEANSHASAIIGLCDLLTFAGDRIDPEGRARVEKQIANGATYLAACQDKAAELGLEAGALSHDLLGHEDVVIPGDMAKAAVAWALTARLLRGTDPERAADYRRRAGLALGWFDRGQPPGSRGFSPDAHGVDESYVVPETWRVEDLLMCCWGYVLRAADGDHGAAGHAVALARDILKRQIPASSAEDGLYGHFRTFGDRGGPTQKAWTHSIYENTFGTDIGASFPFYMLPFIEMCRLWPDHREARAWREAVERFAYGFLQPVCRRSPFLIVPVGVFGDEGLLWFGGLWHGMNSVYGLTAAQALEFETFFGDPAWREIAIGNLQWIAGLNAGVTADSLKGSVVYSSDIPADSALPASMICGIGTRWAGTWLQTRGSICNGFSTGEQFRFDVPPAKATDGPHSFTDEDWITHAGGWLSGLSRLVARGR